MTASDILRAGSVVLGVEGPKSERLRREIALDFVHVRQPAPYTASTLPVGLGPQILPDDRTDGHAGRSVEGKSVTTFFDLNPATSR